VARHLATLTTAGVTDFSGLACGIDGAVLSEYPLGAKPEARHFPRCNRLLTGLSLGTLVIEVGEGSGTLSEDEATALGALDFEPRHVDDLNRPTGHPVSQVTGAVALLESRGR
jgi:predicted Rossmann fold nucleotide-binding protein DprA/Smf involved in DNA uptake